MEMQLGEGHSLFTSGRGVTIQCTIFTGYWISVVWSFWCMFDRYQTSCVGWWYKRAYCHRNATYRLLP